MYINTKGLILRETVYKETSKILTVLTADEGKLTVSAKGARRKGSKLAPCTQFLSFSDMTISGSHDRWTLAEASGIELFEGIRLDLERLALGAYFSQLLEVLCEENQPEPALLNLGLHTLYRLSEGKRDNTLIKGAFEFRLMALAGFMPRTDCCCVCANPQPTEPRLSLEGGTIRCRTCLKQDDYPQLPLCEGSLAALRYCLSADLNKLFSFKLEGEAKKRFSAAAERYLLVQLDRDFHTLDYYKSIKI